MGLNKRHRTSKARVTKDLAECPSLNYPLNSNKLLPSPEAGLGAEILRDLAQTGLSPCLTAPEIIWTALLSQEPKAAHNVCLLAIWLQEARGHNRTGERMYHPQYQSQG